MLIKSFNVFVKLMIFFCIAITLAGLLLFIAISSGPKSLDLVTKYIEREFNKIDNNYQVKVGSSSIIWEKEKRNFVIKIKDTKISKIDKNEEKIIADIPKITIDFNLIKFVSESLLSSSIYVNDSIFYVNTNYKNNSYHLTSPLLATEKTADIINLITTKLPFHKIILQNSYIYITNENNELVWNIKKSELILNHKKKFKSLKALIDIDIGKYLSQFTIESYINKQRETNMNISFTNLSSLMLDDLFPNDKNIANYHALLNGKADILYDKDKKLSQAKIKINHSDLKIAKIPSFPSSYKIKDLNFEADIYNDFTNFTITNFSANVDNYPVRLNLLVTRFDKNIYLKNDSNTNWPEIKLTANTKNFLINDLKNYWPTNFKTKLRDWTINNITNGIIKTASFELNLNHEETKLLFDKNIIEKNIQDKSINLLLDINNCEASFHPNYPIISGVDGEVKITTHNLFADIKKASTNDIEFKNGKLSIEHPSIKIPANLKISGDFIGKNNGFEPFLRPNLSQISDQDLANKILQVKGNFVGELKLELPIKKPLTYDEIKLNIDSQIENIYLKDMFQEHDLNDGKLKLKLNNRNLYLDGGVKFSDIFIKTHIYKYLTNNAQKAEAVYGIKADVNNKILQKFSLPLFDYTNTNFPININYQLNGNIDKTDVEIDLTNNLVDFTELNYQKPQNVPAKISFSLDHNIENKTTKIENFLAKSNDLKLTATATLQNKNLTELEISEAVFANNNFKLKYKNIANKLDVNIFGQKIDISKFKFTSFAKENKIIPSSAKIKLDLKNVFNKNNSKISNLTAQFDCKPEFCDKFLLSGTIADSKNYLNAYLNKDKKINIKSDNAGEILKFIGASAHIVGGEMNIDTDFAYGKEPALLGVMNINNFTAINTPLLGKLLTFASFKGISDLLQSKGVSFDKFETNFTYQNGVINIKDAKTSGSSLGITSSGKIDLRNNQLDLKGLVVPAYELNKIITSIPIISNIITGGKKEGLFAAKYYMKGEISNTNVTFNPLSIFTPGILRDIFGGIM